MSVTEVEHESWFSRLFSSIKSVLIGILLFVLAFPVLFWGEGRAVKRAADLEAGSSSVVSVSADSVDSAQDGALVHLSGEANTDQSLSDSALDYSAPALRLRRNVEMYQWVEHSETDKRKKVGGGTTTVTTYTYALEWSDTPQSSEDFEELGHDNPPMPLQGEDQDTTQARIGARDLSPALVSQIDAFSPVSLDPAALTGLRVGELQAVAHEGAVYFGADPNIPQLGDLSVTLEQVSPPVLVSLVAAQKGDGFEPWSTPDGRELEPRLEVGEHDSAEMFEQMNEENATLTWLIRGGGFAMMLFGMFMTLRPLVVIADVVPFIGSFIEGGAFFISIVVALPLSLGTIAVGWIAYRPLLGIGLIVVAVGVLVGGVMLKRKANAKA